MKIVAVAESRIRIKGQIDPSHIDRRIAEPLAADGDTVKLRRDQSLDTNRPDTVQRIRSDDQRQKSVFVVMQRVLHR